MNIIVLICRDNPAQVFVYTLPAEIKKADVLAGLSQQVKEKYSIVFGPPERLGLRAPDVTTLAWMIGYAERCA